MKIISYSIFSILFIIRKRALCKIQLFTAVTHSLVIAESTAETTSNAVGRTGSMPNFERTQQVACGSFCSNVFHDDSFGNIPI